MDMNELEKNMKRIGTKNLSEQMDRGPQLAGIPKGRNPVRYHEDMLKLQEAQLQALLEIKRLLASK